VPSTLTSEKWSPQLFKRKSSRRLCSGFRKSVMVCRTKMDWGRWSRIGLQQRWRLRDDQVRQGCFLRLCRQNESADQRVHRALRREVPNEVQVEFSVPCSKSLCNFCPLKQDLKEAFEYFLKHFRTSKQGVLSYQVCQRLLGEQQLRLGRQQHCLHLWGEIRWIQTGPG